MIFNYHGLKRVDLVGKYRIEDQTLEVFLRAKARFQEIGRWPGKSPRLVRFDVRTVHTDSPRFWVKNFKDYMRWSPGASLICGEPDEIAWVVHSWALAAFEHFKVVSKLKAELASLDQRLHLKRQGRLEGE